MSDNISTRVFTSYTNKDGCIVQNVWKIKEGYFISVFFFWYCCSIDRPESRVQGRWFNRQEYRNNSGNGRTAWSLAWKPDAVYFTRYLGDKERVSQPLSDLDL